MFRLHPERHSQFHKGSLGTAYVRVLIYPTRAAMYRAHPTERRRKSAAWCEPFREVIRFPAGRRPRRVPIVADVVFSRDRLGTRVVTHELFHATLAYARYFVFNFCRLDALDSVNAQEEWLTHVHSNLCHEFVERAYRAGWYGMRTD